VKKPFFSDAFKQELDGSSQKVHREFGCIMGVHTWTQLDLKASGVMISLNFVMKKKQHDWALVHY